MKKRLQIHVLENIRDNGGWVWAIGPAIATNEEVIKRVKESTYTVEEYYHCVVALIESGKIIDNLPRPMLTTQGETGPLPKRSYDPMCLTLDGYEYIERLRHPVRYWLKQNWFPATIAAATILTGVASAAIQIVSRIIE